MRIKIKCYFILKFTLYSTKFISYTGYNDLTKGESQLIVYADVLVFVNSIIDYFLLLITAHFNKVLYKNSRLIFGAIFGGFSSLYIFVSVKSVIIDFFIKSTFCVLMILISFGIINIKFFLRNVVALMSATFVYAGVILAIWQVFKSPKIFIKNSTVYYDVSITFLIISTVLIYLTISIASALLKRNAIAAEKTEIVLKLKNFDLNLTAIYDTGNSLCDLLGNKEVVLTDEKNFRKLTENFDESELQKRFRVMPCKTVNGNSVLKGIRCDSMLIVKNNREYVFKNPILYLSNTPFDDEFNAILNSEILTRMR